MKTPRKPRGEDSPHVVCVMSGGQTGIDRAALDAAEERSVLRAGWCPAGRRAEDGRIPARYPLSETPSSAYEQRTAWNVRDSDGTLVICQGRPTGGTAWTVSCARSLKKPLYIAATPHMRSVAKVRAWLAAERIRTLNVAGPRAGNWPEGYEIARRLLEGILDTPENVHFSTRRHALPRRDMYRTKNET